VEPVPQNIRQARAHNRYHKFLYLQVLLEHLAPNVQYDLLLIEYQYVRIYINSLSLQAVATRKMRNLAIPSQTEIDMQDYGFIRDVIEGSKEILEMILKLSRAGHLKYVPVRVFIRVASASIYLIKVSHPPSLLQSSDLIGPYPHC
jgi:hypothetical protein